MMPRPAERACHGRVAEPHMPRGDSIRILQMFGHAVAYRRSIPDSRGADGESLDG